MSRHPNQDILARAGEVGMKLPPVPPSPGPVVIEAAMRSLCESTRYDLTAREVQDLLIAITMILSDTRERLVRLESSSLLKTKAKK